MDGWVDGSIVHIMHRLSKFYIFCKECLQTLSQIKCLTTTSIRNLVEVMSGKVVKMLNAVIVL